MGRDPALEQPRSLSSVNLFSSVLPAKDLQGPHEMTTMPIEALPLPKDM